FTVTDGGGFVRKTIYHPALGVPIVDTDVDGVVSSLTYDGIGRLRSHSRPGTPTLTLTYSEVINGLRRGLRTDSSSADGRASYSVVDELGRAIDSATKGFASVWTYDHNELDLYGNAARSARPELSTTPVVWTTRTFDRLGQVLSTTTPDGAITETAPGISETTTTDPN